MKVTNDGKTRWIEQDTSIQSVRNQSFGQVYSGRNRQNKELGQNAGPVIANSNET